MPLPAKPLETCRVQTCRVRPDSLVRVDNNHYSVPSRWVSQWVTVKAYPFRVELWAQGEKVAQHRRSFEAGRTLYDLSHYIGVLERKPRAAGQAKPVRETVAARIQAVRARLAEGPAGDREFVQILRLSLEYGQPALLAALDACQAGGTVSYEAIRFQLLQQLQALSEPQAATSSKCTAFGPAILPTDLKAYDGLLKAGELR